MTVVSRSGFIRQYKMVVQERVLWCDDGGSDVLPPFIGGKQWIRVCASMGMFPGRHVIATSALLRAMGLFIGFESQFGDDAPLDFDMLEAALLS